MWRLVSCNRNRVPALALTIFLGAAWIAPLEAQPNLAYQVANLSEDLRLLDERMRALSVEMDNLRRENAQLRAEVASAQGVLDEQMASLVTVSLLNAELAKVVKQLEQRDEVIRQDTLVQVKRELESKLQEIRKIIGRMPQPAGPQPAPSFSTDFPKTGTTYVVAPGDTLSKIAEKLDSRIDWIQNANQIVKPELMQVGERLFIPQER